MPHLAVETGADKGKKITVPSEGEVTIGRDTSCSYQILDLSASRTHFRIVGSQGKYRLEDLDSRNGTHLNDEKVGDFELDDGDLVRVGDTIFQFILEAVATTADQDLAGAKPKDPLVGKNVGGYEILEMIDWLCFCGHTHSPGIWTEDMIYLTPQEVNYRYHLVNKKTIVNVGSVGQPRDGDPRAKYVLFDGNRVVFRPVEYRVQTTARKIRSIPQLDPYLAERLLQGR